MMIGLLLNDRAVIYDRGCHMMIAVLLGDRGVT